MGTGHRASHELQIAESIMGALPAGSWMRVCSDDRHLIRYSVAAKGLKLTSVIFSRTSLARLAADAAGTVKIDYLRRDLARTAEKRTEFRYPNGTRLGDAPRRTRRSALNPLVAIASVIS